MQALFKQAKKSNQRYILKHFFVTVRNLKLGTYMHFRCWGKTITNWLLEKEHMHDYNPFLVLFGMRLLYSKHIY
jgi:hypothetical protein